MTTWATRRPTRASGIQDGMSLHSLEQHGFSDYMGLGDSIHHTQGGHQFDSLTTGSAIQWLRSYHYSESNMNNNNTTQPWLLAVNLVNPHDIMFFNTDAPDEVVQGNWSMADISKAPNHSIYKKQHPSEVLPTNWKQPLNETGRPKAHANYHQIYDLMVGKVPMDDQDRLTRAKDYYLNCIQDMDDQVTKLLDELEAQDLFESTVIVYTSDHGEMGGAHGLRGKGSFAYREQNNVPLVVVHPEYPGGNTCQTVTTHIDLLPTIISISAATGGNQTTILDQLPGNDFTNLLKSPEEATYDALRPNGALFTYNMLATNMDPSYIREAVSNVTQFSIPNAPKFEHLRGALRSVYDGRYRYSRYFFPKQHNTPTTLEDILRWNDIELFDHELDPYENTNLAAIPQHYTDLIMKMNDKLNTLIAYEIGEDVGQMLPFGKTLVNWAIPKTAMAGI